MANKVCCMATVCKFLYTFIVYHANIKHKEEKLRKNEAEEIFNIFFSFILLDCLWAPLSCFILMHSILRTLS